VSVSVCVCVCLCVCLCVVYTGCDVTGCGFALNLSSRIYADPRASLVNNTCLYLSAWGRRVHGDPAEPAYYYTLPYHMHEELKQATTELHKMFLEATRHVLATPALWPAFAFPDSFWPRAQASFDRADHLVCGRFDFCLQMDTGVFKAFEYNADSASCLLECGLSQGKWGEAVGLVGAVGTCLAPCCVACS
jgi:glutathionylspermidine synthase